MLAVGAGIWAYLLQQVAFPAAGSSAEQISATVYVEKLPAQVSLQSTFTPVTYGHIVAVTCGNDIVFTYGNIVAVTFCHDLRHSEP